MHRPVQRSLAPAALLCFASLIAGCGSNPSCGGNQDYQASVNRPRLELPPQLAASERLNPLVIPEPVSNPAVLDPAPRCLDEPPPYFARRGAVADAAGDSVRLWARAWSERRADAVMQMYSASFRVAGEGGSADFMDQRRAQIGNGPAPDAQLEGLSVVAQGEDRRIATFVQRFGDDQFRKELVLQRESGGVWRIVSERTSEVL
jgi:hypothetical protein